MLKRLQSFSQNLTLIGHSGVQFVDYGFKLDKPFSREFFEQRDTTRTEDPDDGPGRELRRITTSAEDSLDAQTGQPVKSVSRYDIKAIDALAIYNNMWLPVPFLKIRGANEAGGFEAGPSNWARMRVSKLEQPDTDGYQYRVTFAFDTRILKLPAGAPYSGPREEDMWSESRFKLAADLAGNNWFLHEPWVWRWLRDTLKQASKVSTRKPLVCEDGSSTKCSAWAYYLVVLDAIGTFMNGTTSNGPLPTIRFVDPFPGNGAYHPIDVHLVMDIGNSRTCGVLIERDRSAVRVDLRTAIRLELRDLSRPHLVHDEPFRSHVEFARAEFGLNHHAFAAGDQNAFLWPSLMRVGPEALRLNGAGNGADGDTGLSGPKRYLWDDREHQQQWYFNVAEDWMLESAPVFGDVLNQLTQDGRLLSTVENGSPAFIPKFSKASLFSFMVMELLLQALAQINSIGHRTLTKLPNVPRKLTRVVLTIPTGTPLMERERFQAQCDNAVKLLWESLGWAADDGAKHLMPEIDIAYDEATCTQLVWLYSELREKFLSKPNGYLKAMGTPREGGHSLRIASLDVGGGTTDLMIRTYTVQSQNDALQPVENFREGFRRAGDDIVEAIISVYVLGSIVTSLEKEGLSAPGEFIEEFINDRGKSATERHRRTLFVNRVLTPIALAILTRFEANGLLDLEQETLTMREVFPSKDESVQVPVAFFDNAARAAGAQGFALENVTFELEYSAIGKTIENVIAPILEPLCAATHELQADVLLVSGRPSRLPTIRDLLLRYAPVAPHRIVFMHDYDVGNWYPFSGRLGRIGDPKTTVVVGALLCTLASTRRIQDFALDESALVIESTANFVGRIFQGQILVEDVILGASQEAEFETNSKPVVFNAPLYLGFRQLPLERWPATPLFFLDFPEPPSSALERTLPWTVEFARSEVDKERSPERAALAVERLRINKIRDKFDKELRPNQLALRLQTLMEEGGYWTDTGIVEFVR